MKRGPFHIMVTSQNLRPERIAANSVVSTRLGEPSSVEKVMGVQPNPFGLA